jgi:hypothetical protein
MVLVAPRSVRRETSAPGTETGRDEVLALLRNGSGQRPRFDPGLAGGFRAWLEDAASSVVGARGEDAPRLFLGPRQLLGEPVDGVAADSSSGTLVTACLVHALFRQIVTTGSVDDPLADGLSALAVDPRRGEMVRQVGELGPVDREALSSTLRVHVANLFELTPRFAPGWLPRTDDRVAIPLAGGRVVLHGLFDLLVGAPVPDTASLCAVGLTPEGPWALARRRLHYLALLETLRSGTPPFRVGLLHSGAGRYGAEDVLEEHLGAVVAHLAGRLSEMARAGA